MKIVEESRIIAVFDFDGTITVKDTLFDFIVFCHGGWKLVAGLLILSPILVLFKLGFITNESAKQRMFSFFFKGKKKPDFDLYCQRYSRRIDEITNLEAADKIKWHQSEGHQIIIISASIVDWIKPWANTSNIEEVIGTQIEIKDNIITGRFASKNCYGREKVNRLLALYPDRDSYKLYAYGDSSGDKELLSIADYPFYRKF
ncbi:MULTISPECIES: HAD-IB family hydrolase [unclassified Dysgonomonas]|uniref:HAD-IB family hydrolase n=1 Tax=unclassified Dysgonomonas TaxID=2630389 RepID=UPI0013EA8422|nr:MULTISPECIES: HAD-IB family hydrolase [unclassified Dysgonomonas]